MGAAACNCESSSSPEHEFAGDTVYVNVYDLNEDCRTVNQIANDIMQIGGAFHAGLEIHGREWSYGEGGVTCSKPRQHEVHVYRQSIVMGTTVKTEQQVKAYMQGVMSMRWTGDDYQLLNHNCCSFVDEALRDLTGRGLPGWVNRLARFASSTQLDPEDLAQLGRYMSDPRPSLLVVSPQRLCEPMPQIKDTACDAGSENIHELRRSNSQDSRSTSVGSDRSEWQREQIVKTVIV